MTPPRVLVAPDAFKGTHAAAEVADAIARGLERGGAIADRCPLGDGGEGTQDALLAARGGRVIPATAHDPLGRPLTAAFALLGDDGATAVIETAAAGGLPLLALHERDPWNATTYGTGELIAAALDAGARELLVAAGGSATVDGGAGALAALDARRPGGLASARLVVLCDVRTAWEDCARVYGPQKGADPAMVERLRARLDAQAQALQRDPRGVPMSGAAGGLAGALWAAHGAELVPGAPFALDAAAFDMRLRGAAAVVCGEGRLDAQSGEGKLVGEIARRARAAGVPAFALVGGCALEQDGWRALGLDDVRVASTLAELEAAGEQVARALPARG